MPHYTFFGGSSWARSTPVSALGARSAEVLAYDGPVTASTWPEAPPSWLETSSPAAQWIPIPGLDQALGLPAGALSEGEPYTIGFRARWGANDFGTVAAIHDQHGALRLLHVSGEAAVVEPMLADLGWTLRRTPVCWFDECYQPTHLFTAEVARDGLVIPIGDRRVDRVVVAGGAFTVYGDALAAPADGADVACADVNDSFYLFTVLATAGTD